MEQILLLTKEYSKNRHLEMIQRVSNNVMDELELLYDTTWEINKHIAPYEICLLYTSPSPRDCS
mgnify:CR=1 FL=1